MGKGTVLSSEEKSKIEAYFERGLSLNKIAGKTGRHRKTIASFLHNKEHYGKNFKGGNNRVVSEADMKAIIREASNSHESSTKIRAKTGVKASLSTVQRVIRKASQLQIEKLKEQRPLNMIGIIGGSGLNDPDILEQRKELVVKTPFGDPSDVLSEGEIAGVKCVLLARHGRKHNIMPSNVNYRANVWALKEVGCTHLIVSTACGSLREDIKPGNLAIPYDIIDRTTKRCQTFHDGMATSPQGICHLPMYPAFNERCRRILLNTAKELGYEAHDKVTMVTIEGPRFSSRAESNMFRQWGGDLINMTTCPEVVLAKEAGLMYAAVAIATDYDCWRSNCESVNVQDVLKTFGENCTKVKQILVKAVGNIARENWSEDIAEANKYVINNTMSHHA